MKGPQCSKPRQGVLLCFDDRVGVYPSGRLGQEPDTTLCRVCNPGAKLTVLCGSALVTLWPEPRSFKGRACTQLGQRSRGNGSSEGTQLVDIVQRMSRAVSTSRLL